MNAEELYFEMKCALEYFGLSFNEKHEMTVACTEGFIVFSHDDREVKVKLKATGD